MSQASRAPATLSVLGAGRVGQTLAALWQQQGTVQLQALLCRSLQSAQAAAQFVGAGQPVTDVHQLAPAQVWLIGTPDAQIAPMAAALAQRARQAAWAPAIALHCSGFCASDALDDLRALGWAVASAHPVMSFASPQVSAQQFAGTLCGLEGDEEALAWLRAALPAIGGRCFDLRADAKVLYHAAAVFCSNFSVVLQGVAQAAWQDAGIDDTVRDELQRKLLQATVANTFALGPARAITGPAARGDTAVVQAQGAVVRDWHAEAGALYAQLSAMAARLAQTGSVLGATTVAATDADSPDVPHAGAGARPHP